MDIPELKGPSVMMQNILLKWLSCLLCGKAEKRRILLCYHSRDEGNVKKFLKSLHNIKADVIVKNESEARDDDDDYSNFSKGIVLICLSKEYVVSQAFEKDFRLASIRGNDLSLTTFDPMVSQWQNYQNNLLVFDKVYRPSVFTLRKTQEGSKKYVFISNHPNNAREVNKICAILKKYDVECTISKYRTLAEIDNDVMHRLTEDLSIATHHLVFLSRDYIQDEFCQFEQRLIRNIGKRFRIYWDKQIDILPLDLNKTWIVPYEDDDLLLEVSLKHTFISRAEEKIVLISTTDKYLAEELQKELRKIYKHHEIYWTLGLDKNRKYTLIADCEIFIACLSNIYFDDVTCRKDIEFANALWKRILPLDITEGSPRRRPEWLIRIVGTHRYPHNLQDHFDELHAAHANNWKEEEWIRKRIQVPCQPSIDTSLPSINKTMTMTDAYGNVEVFAEGGLEHYIAHYVRLGTTTSLNIVSSLLMRHWGLKRPQLLISITGEGSGILSDPMKTRFFTSAFENIVKESGVWFTTDGATSEISKVIGQVVEKEDVNERPTVIGIASWEFLKMNHSLMLKNGFGRWPAQYNTREAAAATGDYYLNPFCTHFLLPVKSIEVKNGISNQVSTAKFRADLEEYIRRGRFKINKPEDDMSVTVPSVLLVVEGDQYQSVSMIRRSLDAQRYVIVFKGTGGLADTLADVHENRLRSHDGKIMEIINHENNKEFLRFVDINDETHQLEGVLIEDLLRDIVDSNEKKLFLALAFNNSDKAMQHVFASHRPDLTDTFKNNLMIRAMRDGKREFVRLLIKECVDIHRFQRSNYQQLFQADRIPDELKRQVGWGVDPTVDNIMRFVVRSLQMDVFVSYGLNEKSDQERLMTFDNEGLIKTLKFLASFERAENQSDPYFYLMIWAILMMNLQDIAKFFWQHCKEPIPSALIASGIYRVLRKNCQPANRLLADKLFKAEKEFQDLACGVLNQCYTDHPDETDRILTRKRPRWRNLTCLEIAYQMKVYSFMSQEACKIPINRVWFGKISADNSAIRMVMSVFILGLLPFVLRFDRSDKRKAKENTCMTKIGNRIYNFYTAPIMRFSHTMTSYIVFLGFFSYALLTGFGNEVTWVEILMYVWVFCLMLDEVRELIYAMADLKKRLGPNFFSERPYAVQVYFLDKWNYFDITTLCFFTIGVILDLLGYYETVEVGRVFLAISLIAFFMRILKAFSALEELGPKVWMIASMAKDLLYFVVILMLFVVSYAVAAYAIMYPQSELSVDLFFNVLRLGYWNLYGELLLDDIEAEEPDCTFDAAVYNSGTLPRCAEKHRRVIGLVLMGIYLIFANVMLLNILIAMFTDTYQRIQTKRDHKWNYERYALVREFKRVPIFPMPLGILLLFFNFVKGIYKTCRKCNTVENYDKELLVSLKSSDMMFSLEREMVYLYMKKRSEDTAYSALTEERIAKIVAMQVEKKLHRLQSIPNDNVLKGTT
uniref:Transient receptor potential cation channel subfamily M member 3 n=1 Tax=Magallana gigas TaxID=29159 RepID=A0A8W8KFY9_MAGGI|nr:transient receptor potential cation channel subfamily M member-like 2 [Crassostrea gigas]XP_034338905.1 transient receptor potential cation channel subfamily M member-like 2 [Crassostrea gigas]